MEEMSLTRRIFEARGGLGQVTRQAMKDIARGNGKVDEKRGVKWGIWKSCAGQE